MSKYKPYPAYKKSDVEWIDMVPEHWSHRKVAWDLQMTIGWTPPTGNRSYYGGPHNWVSIADLSAGKVANTKQTITDAALDLMRGTQAPAGSLLFSYKLSIGEVALLDQPAYTNEAIAAFHPCERVHMPFWKYAAPVIFPNYSRENIYGSALLNQELMNSARMYLPDISEQETIAAVLDRETARIDALIDKKSQFIALLKEKRQALITHAVTKGLDPNVKMKDSGVEWIGEVPEHWKVLRVANLGELKKAKGGTKQDNVDYGICGVRYGDIYTSHHYVIRSTTTYIDPSAVPNYTAIQYGDVLFAASGETYEDIGKSVVNLMSDETVCGGDVIVLHLFREYDPLFMGYALDCSASREQKTGMGKGYTVVHIYAEQLRNLVVAIPPWEEQTSIGLAIDRETARIDILITKTQLSIDLLKERRSAFITAAVTGKIDLRESK